jgi:hypothetical protein
MDLMTTLCAMAIATASFSGAVTIDVPGATSGIAIEGVVDEPTMNAITRADGNGLFIANRDLFEPLEAKSLAVMLQGGAQQWVLTDKGRALAHEVCHEHGAPTS